MSKKIKTISDLEFALYKFQLTEWDDTKTGYMTGLDRCVNPNTHVSHIYKGSYDNVEKGMCNKAYRKDGSISIFRNNFGIGVCQNCLKNTLKELNSNK